MDTLRQNTIPGSPVRCHEHLVPHNRRSYDQRPGTFSREFETGLPEQWHKQRRASRPLDSLPRIDQGGERQLFCNNNDEELRFVQWLNAREGREQHSVL
jgi:hypothetical protein